jgi:TolB protein
MSVTSHRGALLVAVGGALALLVPAGAGQAAFPGHNGRIAIDREIGGNDEIVTMDSHGEHQRRLTDNDVDDRNPVYSPNGNRIVFQRDTGTDDDIFAMDADGSHIRRLTNNDVGDFEPAFSPSGKRIAFESNRVTAGNPEGDSEIWTMRKDGSHVRQLTSNTDVGDNDPAWSPNGERIVFSRGDRKIIVMDADGSHEKKLSGGGFNDDPNWSPSGRRIVYGSDQGGSDFEIVSVPARGGSEKPLTTNDVGDYQPAYSPNGKSIVFVSEQGGGNVYRMDADGTPRGKVTDNGKDEESPDWGVR